MREKVAFVPGAPFYPNQPRLDTLRLNFSNRPPQLIAKGMAILGACAAQRLATFQFVAKANNRTSAPVSPPSTRRTT